MEDPVADIETGGLGARRLGDELAFDGARAGPRFAVTDAFDGVAGAGAPIVAGGVRPVLLGALPAGRLIIVLEGIGLVEARLAVTAATVTAIRDLLFGDFHMGERQLVEEA